MTLSRVETLTRFTEYIKTSTPFSFSSFTVDDIQLLLRGAPRLHILERPTVNDYVTENYEEYVSDIVNIVSSATFKLSTHNLDKYIHNFFFEIKRSKRKKVLFGSKLINEAEKMLNINLHVVTPVSVDAIVSNYHLLLEYMEDTITDGDIVLLSCGYNSHIINDLIKDINKNTTCINMGSMLTDIFIGRRDYEVAHKDNLQEFFKGLL